jgi:hypothetical protein
MPADFGAVDVRAEARTLHRSEFFRKLFSRTENAAKLSLALTPEV